MRWPAAFVSRLALTAGVIAALAGPSAATLWVGSPDGTDVQQRVRAVTEGYAGSFPTPDGVPPVLANAAVAPEDEPFYPPPGAHSFAPAPPLLFCIPNAALSPARSPA